MQVHSTLAAGLLPPGPIASVDDVYAWLRGLLQAVWRDPVCGDGVCEAPFEYAQYGRFGCRADCGRLQDIQVGPLGARAQSWAPARALQASGAACGHTHITERSACLCRPHRPQNLTAIQLDLQWDFSHPAGSIPATVSGRGVRCCAHALASAALAQPANDPQTPARPTHRS